MSGSVKTYPFDYSSAFALVEIMAQIIATMISSMRTNHVTCR